MSTEVKHLSDAIMEPLTRAYRIGGFGLAFLLLGGLLTLTATFLPRSPLSYLLATTGFLLIAVPCYFFYVKEIRPIARAQRGVIQNREMIDAVQATALSMTELTLEMQALAFKYADQVTHALDIARPQIRAVPLIGRLADHPALTTSDRLSRVIVSTTKKIREVVTDVQAALVASDPSALRKYVDDVNSLRGEITLLLTSGSGVSSR